MPGLMGRTMMAMAARTVGRSLGGASAGPIGLAVGVALPVLTRSLGPAGMVALAVGSWAVRRAVVRNEKKRTAVQPVVVPPVTPTPGL
ncbi:hypothetical protein [Polymorphobacter sp.]|uniref:hypothetical protein n=1 Tax=Polymorphobacter sp. TaxID=1909290 RepID=UPI003F710994